MKILVAIANYGTKNLKYLQVLLTEYQKMPFEIEMVVLSNEPKKFGPNIEVLVGLPDKNPWSLPFAHKPLFAERRNDYDLFIYTEDDVLITEQNIRAFLRASEVLPEDKIPGFIRSEISPLGKRYYSTMHCHYHWEPDSVLRRQEMTFARYTNDHSGCVMLTRAQLGRALASPGFLAPFRRGRYGYPETAATDAYTQCGFQKLICISHVRDFCLPHLPNLYVGKLGVDQETANREIAKLLALDGKNEAWGPLFKTETKLESPGWDKEYYEAPRQDVVAMVPRAAKTVLSVGCGWGATEAKLFERGTKVTAIPLDCVVAVTAAARGIEVLPSSLEEAGRQLAGRRFDCIIVNDSLHRFQNPVAVLKEFGEWLAADGTMVLSLPNFNHVSVWKARLTGRLKLAGDVQQNAFEQLGFHVTTRRKIRGWLARAGFKAGHWREEVPVRFSKVARFTPGLFRGWLVENLVVAVHRNSARVVSHAARLSQEVPAVMTAISTVAAHDDRQEWVETESRKAAVR